MAIGIFSNSGNDVRLLKDQLDLNGTAKVLTGTDDPRSVAKNAPQGSIYLQTGTTGGKIFKKLDAGSSTNWTEVGSGAGGINYILNPDAEAGTTGWATYADTAASTPVDGTGGTPNVTFTTSSSSPLRGNNSFLITKDAANRQGQGASYAFTIDTADRSSVMAIEFDYAVASGTFAAGDSSDIRVFVYDITNAQLITPVSYTIQSNTQSKFKGLFQTNSNSSSYRLIFHVATTSASAYTFKIDNVRVGPQTVVFGAAVTDWTEYALTIGATTTAPTLPVTVSMNRAIYRRVGGALDWHFELETSGGSGADGSGAYLFPLPAGLSIDTTKLQFDPANGLAVVGVARFGSGATDVPCQVAVYNATNLALVKASGIAAAAYLGSSDLLFTSSDPNLTAHVSGLPILGWASGVQISNDAETRIVAARYTTGAGQSIPDNTNTVLDFGTKDFDTHNAVTTGASWRYTAPVSGYYRVAVCATFTANGGGTRAGILRKNGVDHSVMDSQLSFGSGQPDAVQGCALVQLNPGDYIDLVVFQNTGGAKSMDTTTTGNYIAIDRVSGPSAIAANELIACHAVLTSDQTIASGATDIVVFNNTSTNGGFDTHAALNTATGRFTAPVSGTYLIASTIIANATAANWSVIAYKNGSAAKAFGRDDTTSLFQMGGSVLQRLVAGDIIDIRVTKSGGGSVVANGTSDSLASTVSIHRVGF